MIKRISIAPLLLLILNLATAPTVLASGNAEKEAKLAENIKANIIKLGTGSESKIKLKLKDGSKIKGYAKEVRSDDFVVMNSKTNETVNVPYSGVKQVKGNNLSTGVKIVIGIGLFVLLLVWLDYELGKS